MKTKKPIEISETTQLLLDSFRILEQARAKYWDYLTALTKGNDELFEQYADMSDKAWNPIREKIVDEINTALYDWANATPEKVEI